MKRKVTVYRPKPHTGQEQIIKTAGRFNVIRNGRRWGKTKFAVMLAMDSLLKGEKVGVWFPTYEFAEEFWEELVERLEPITKKKDTTRHRLDLINKGHLKIWSMEKKRSGRGRKYHRAIVDEAAFGKDLKESFDKVIRATLTDYKGDAWIFSTPNGRKNYFFELDQNSKKYDNWKSFHMPSSSNPILDPNELEEIRLQLDELTWLQEFMAEYVDFTGRPFAYAFEDRHVGDTGKPKISLPLDLSFDFNVDPITCLACQHSEEKDEIRIHKEFRLKNSDVYELCDAIIAEYGDRYYFRVTGDASGKNRSAMVSDNLNYYKIIMKRLKLETDQMFVPGANPAHRNSRTLTNSLFKRHPKVIIDKVECKLLIEDLKFVECSENGEIDKDKDKHRGHLLDCIRYYFNTWHYSFLGKYNDASD